MKDTEIDHSGMSIEEKIDLILKLQLENKVQWESMGKKLSVLLAGVRFIVDGMHLDTAGIKAEMDKAESDFS